jgi:hypothetical protein
MTLDTEAVEASLSVFSAVLLLPPVVDMGLDLRPGDLHVLTQLHRPLLAKTSSLRLMP